MFVELIATVFAGIACAGLAMVLNLITGKRLPKWLMPVAAGFGMIAMTISNEYTWFARMAERLPEGVVIATTVEEQSWIRPWTQIWPYTKRFVAADTATARRNEAVPDQRMVDLYFFGRWSPINQVPLLMDCAGARSAILVDGARFASDGTVSDASWQSMPGDDPILKLVCES